MKKQFQEHNLQTIPFPTEIKELHQLSRFNLLIGVGIYQNIVWDLISEPVYNKEKSKLLQYDNLIILDDCDYIYSKKDSYFFKIDLNFLCKIQYINLNIPSNIYEDLRNGLIVFICQRIFDFRLRKNLKLRSKLFTQKEIKIIGFSNHYYGANDYFKIHLLRMKVQQINSENLYQKLSLHGQFSR